MSDHNIQEPLFYTEDEVTAKVNEAVHKHSIEALDALERNRESAIQWSLTKVQENILTVLRATELVDRETAIALYNEIADFYGWDHATVLTQYEVEVIYDDTTVGSFTVEAEDEDAAIEVVRDNMEAEATMTVSVSYDDQTCEGEIYVSQWDLNDFAFNAQEA